MVALTKARRRLSDAGDDVRDKLPDLGDLRDKLPDLSDVRDKLPDLGDVRDKLPDLSDVREKLPDLGDMRDKLPSLGDVREKLTSHVEIPQVQLKPALRATRRAVPAAKLATAVQRRLPSPDAVKVRITRQPPQHHRIRNLLLLLALGGIGYVVYRKFVGGGGTDWVDAGSDGGRSSAPVASTPPEPTPPKPAPPKPAPPKSADTDTATAPAAPTAPLAAEETVEAPLPTTPDEPLLETKVDAP